MDDTTKTQNTQPRSNGCSFCGRPRGAFKEIVENPNGNVLLVAPMLPNCQCKTWRNNQEIFEDSF